MMYVEQFNEQRDTIDEILILPNNEYEIISSYLPINHYQIMLAKEYDRQKDEK